MKESIKDMRRRDNKETSGQKRDKVDHGCQRKDRGVLKVGGRRRSKRKKTI